MRALEGIDLGQSALLMVDVQRDFCPGGSMGIDGADGIIGPLNEAIVHFQSIGRPVFASRDWHPPETIHFKAQGGPWAVHCVRDTFGAEFYPDLAVPADATIISKGISPDEHAYSSFDGYGPGDARLDAILKGRGIQHLVIGGLSFVGCVRATVLDGRELGYRVTVLKDGVKASTRGPRTHDGVVEELTGLGVDFR